MRWSFPIARVAGIPVKIHATFLLLLSWISIVYYRAEGAFGAVASAVFIIAVFGCVLLHEFGHAFAARACGIHTADITLLPIGGVARLLRLPETPWQELVITAAGPAVNLIIGIVLVSALGPDWIGKMLHGWNGSGEAFLAKLAGVNLGLVLFNLMPAFPMDGGRILRALLAFALPYTSATNIAARVGQAFAIVLASLGLITNPLLIITALVVFVGARREAAAARFRDVTRRLRIAHRTPTWVFERPVWVELVERRGGNATRGSKVVLFAPCHGK